MELPDIIEAVGRFMDVAGVAVMVIGAVVSVPMAFRGFQPRKPPAGTEPLSVYRSYRQLLGRSILLGLELLVAADIIRTVAVAPTYESVGVLAIIVLIRTFLSFSSSSKSPAAGPGRSSPTSAVRCFAGGPANPLIGLDPWPTPPNFRPRSSWISGGRMRCSCTGGSLTRRRPRSCLPAWFRTASTAPRGWG